MTAVEHHDFVIVGARIAGCLTASFLARGGADVLVVERSGVPSPTLSTHFFRGDNLVRVLDAAKMLPEVLALGSPQLTREFNYERGEPSGTADPVQGPGAAGYCLSVRREVLDPTLMACARRHGAKVETSTRALDIVVEDGRVRGVALASGRMVEADLVIGADGYRSMVASKVAAVARESYPGRRALYYRYVRAMRGPDGVVDAVEFSLLGDELAYVFPSDNGYACIALSINLEEYESFRHRVDADFDHLLRRHTALWSRYAEATDHSRVLGTGPREDFVRQAAGDGWALVGDSGIHQDPWSGFGMDSAGVTALILAEQLLAAGSLRSGAWRSAYEKARDEAVLDWFHQTVAGAADLSVLAE